MRQWIGTSAPALILMLAVAGGSNPAAAASRDAMAPSQQVSQADMSGTRHLHRGVHYAYRPYYPYRYGRPYYYSPGPFFPYLLFPDWQDPSLW